jgi:ABC-type branched-subunit amino acid transport system ATPase component
MRGGALTISALSVRRGGRRVLTDLDLTVHQGEIVALVGENGAGKTTLLDAITGAVRTDAGHIRVDGRPLRRGDPRVVRTLQSGGLFPRLSAADNLALVGGGPTSDLPAGPAAQLPPGRARTVEILRAAARRPVVLLLDEPGAGVDDVAGIVPLVRRVAPDAAVLIVDHRAEVIDGADRVVRLRDGRLVDGATPLPSTPCPVPR